MEQRGKQAEAVAVDEQEPSDEADPGSHLDDIEDGCGCAEVWEHMSDRRAEE